MNSNRLDWIGSGRRILPAFFLMLSLVFSAATFAQAPSAAEMDKLVAPIALYPDDLVAIILPASTFPLEIVQAERFLDKRKQDKNLQPNASWNDSVKALVNYPDVIKKMNVDLDWTSDLGEAVVADQSAVLEAVQRYRRLVKGVGNLKSDDKQTVTVEKEIITIVQADPQVIYVPQYNPTTVVVAGGYPYGYYPSPYPVYHYPYAPGAAFATGLIWGAAIGAAWSGGRWGCNYGGGGNNNINIDNSTNINRSGNTINRGGNTAGQGSAWKSDKKPGQVSSGSRGNSQRVGDRQAGAGGDRGGAGSASRPSVGTSDRGGSGSRDYGGGAGSRGGASSRDYGGSSNRGGDAFGGSGAGSSARGDSSRGASSRESMGGANRGGGSRSSASAGGGSRGGGGGGGSRGGGGRR